MSETGVIYFRLNKDQHGYDGDETKNCSLTGVEIDKNFHFLRGNDIASGAWHSEDGGYIKFTRVNGTDFTVSGINASHDISLEGSEFLTESGGTLSLVINNGEPYYITGMTEIFEDFIDSLSGLTCQCPDDSSITADIIALAEELDGQREYFEQKIKDIEHRIDALIEDYEAFKSETCEKFETEKNQRIREDNKLYGLITAETETRRIETDNLQRNIEGRTDYFQTQINRIDNSISENAQEIALLSRSVEASVSELEGEIEAEKNERKEADTSIRESIAREGDRITALSGVVINEEVIRTQRDNELQSQITHNANKNTELASNLVSTQREIVNERTQRQDADNNLRSAIDAVRETVSSEEHQRLADISRIFSDYLSRFEYTNEQIELVRDYVNNLYIDDPSNPEDCDDIKWGVIIKTDNETGKRRIVLNLNPNDEFLSQCNRYLSSTISLRYNSDNNHIELIGKNGTAVSYVDANVFIQKGFLKGATVENRIVHDVEEPCLILTWDTGDGQTSETVIPAADLFTEYTQGNGINIQNHSISVVLRSGEPFLDFDSNGRLITKGIETRIRELASEILSTAIETSTSSLNVLIKSQVGALRIEMQRLLDEKLDKSDFSQYTATTDTVISDIQDAVEDLSEEVEICQNDISGLTTDVSGLTVSVANLDSDVDQLEGRVSSTETSIGQINAKIEELEEEIAHGGGISEDIIEKLDETGVTTQPSASIILMVQENGQTARTARACEVGTVITIVSTETGFTEGYYEYGPHPTGVEATGSVVSIENNGQTLTDTTFTVEDSTNVRAKVSVTHTSGVTAQTKLGRKDSNPNHTIQAGTVTSYSASITGYRYSFYKSIATTADTFTEESVKLSANKATSNSFNLDILPNDKEVVIAIPANKSLIKALDVNFNDTDISPNFLMTTCQVGGYDGFSKVTYKVYYYIPDVPFLVNNTYKITIG